MNRGYEGTGFIHGVNFLATANKNEVGFLINCIYQEINELLNEERYQIVDSILKDIKVGVLQHVFVIAFLTITLATKDKLPHRKILFKKLKAMLDKLNIDSNYVLKGLE